jgi:recombinational DNA repair protein (RecF pathway)
MEEKYVQTTDKCSLCGFKDKISGFSLKDGGLVCRACDRDGIYDLPVETLRKVITLFKIDKIEQLQLINFLPAEESNLVEMFYHFASDVLG